MVIAEAHKNFHVIKGLNSFRAEFRLELRETLKKPVAFHEFMENLRKISLKTREEIRKIEKALAPGLVFNEEGLKVSMEDEGWTMVFKRSGNLKGFSDEEERKLEEHGWNVLVEE